MERTGFVFHEIKGYGTSLPGNSYRETLLQGDQSDICKNVHYSIVYKKKWETAYVQK